MIRRPIVTERSMDLTRQGLYTFEVDKNATKEQIAKIVKEMFKVDVVSVKSFNVKGKVKMQRTRRGYYSTPTLKKALVQVKKGQKISLFENLGEEPKDDVVVTTGEGEPIEVKEKKGRLGGPKVKIEKTDAKKETKKGSK